MCHSNINKHTLRVLLFRVFFTNELLRKGVNVSLFLPYHQIIDL